jgi:hypothetical protein
MVIYETMVKRCRTVCGMYDAVNNALGGIRELR